MNNQVKEWTKLLAVEFPDQEIERLAYFAFLCRHLELAGTFDKGAIIIHDLSTGKDKPLIKFPCLGTIDTFLRPDDKTLAFISCDMDWDKDTVSGKSNIFNLSTLLTLLKEYGYTEENEGSTSP